MLGLIMAPQSNPPNQDTEPPGRCVRALLRNADRASLASALARDGSGRPYASLVLMAVDHDASPILLLSDLADHAKNLKADPRAALLVDGTAGYADPLTGPRATLLGRIHLFDDSTRDGPTRGGPMERRYLARHPSATRYAGFGDFRFYRMEIESAHLVAGFGRIHWLTAGEVTFDTASCQGLVAAEAGLVEHMNHDHGEALRLIAETLPGRDTLGPGRDTRGAETRAWRVIGLDPEGFDLRRGPYLARVPFDSPVTDAASARGAMIALVERTRRHGKAAPR